MERDAENYIMQLEKRLVLLEGRVALLEARLTTLIPTPSVPINAAPWPKETMQKSCAVCGIAFTDTMGRPITLGYACNRANCPSGYYSMTAKAEPVQNYGTVWMGEYSPLTRGDLDL